METFENLECLQQQESAERVLKNILYFCEGYEKVKGKRSEDYLELKSHIEEKYEEVKENENGNN